VPAPPFVTDASTDDLTVDALVRALRATLTDLNAANCCRSLLLGSVARLPIDAYQPIADQESDARERGYPQLA